MTTDVELRAAVAADAEAIGAVQAGSWRAAYAGLLPAEFLEHGVDAADLARFWRERLTAPAQAAATLVALDAGAVVGFIAVGASRDDDPEASQGEVGALYVAPGSSGRGVGSTLLDAGVEALGAAGFADASLWVLAGNLRAQGFYARHGWPRDRALRNEDFGGTMVSEIRLSRPL